MRLPVIFKWFKNLEVFPSCKQCSTFKWPEWRHYHINIGCIGGKRNLKHSKDAPGDWWCWIYRMLRTKLALIQLIQCHCHCEYSQCQYQYQYHFLCNIVLCCKLRHDRLSCLQLQRYWKCIMRKNNLDLTGNR